MIAHLSRLRLETPTACWISFPLRKGDGLVEKKPLCVTLQKNWCRTFANMQNNPLFKVVSALTCPCHSWCPSRLSSRRPLNALQRFWALKLDLDSAEATTCTLIFCFILEQVFNGTCIAKRVSTLSSNCCKSSFMHCCLSEVNLGSSKQSMIWWKSKAKDPGAPCRIFTAAWRVTAWGVE